MTSNRKAKKMSAMEAHRAVNRQFYRRQEVLDYPDIIHVKNDDPHRSDVVCFHTFGQAYMVIAACKDIFDKKDYAEEALTMMAALMAKKIEKNGGVADLSDAIDSVEEITRKLDEQD